MKVLLVAMTAPPELVGVMIITIIVSVSAAILAWRERPEPGAWPLALLLVGQSIWSLLFLFELRSPTLAEKLLWYNLSWVGVVIIPVAWLLFALEYTGRDRYVTTKTILGLSIPPAITVVLAISGDPYHLLYLDTKLVMVNGMQVLQVVGGQWYWAITGYTYLLGLLGSIPLLELVRSETKTFRGQSALTLIGILTPWVVNVVFLSGLIPELGYDPTPIAFTVSGVAYLGAIRWYRLFGASPAPTRGAHRLVFERMQEGALVLDRNGNVVDINANVAGMFEVDPSSILGRPAAEVIPEFESLSDTLQSDGHYEIDRNGTTEFFDVSVTRVTDYHDRVVGKVITFHDVGQHLRQQQRLEVLNRVLRHNIRSESQLIYGCLDDIPQPHASIEEAKRHLEDIERLSKQARTIDNLFEMEERHPNATPLTEMLEEAIRGVRERYPSVDIGIITPDNSYMVSSIFLPVFSNLIENAAEHNTNPQPVVEIRCDRDGGSVRVEVADNGPGIDDNEREVMEKGRETPLKHGSGLGLWVITWGTRIGDGEVVIEDNDPVGSVITVTVPIIRDGSTQRNSRELPQSNV